jgi:hypothetical protein
LTINQLIDFSETVKPKLTIAKLPFSSRTLRVDRQRNGKRCISAETGNQKIDRTAEHGSWPAIRRIDEVHWNWPIGPARQNGFKPPRCKFAGQ